MKKVQISNMICAETHSKVDSIDAEMHCLCGHVQVTCGDKQLTQQSLLR